MSEPIDDEDLAATLTAFAISLVGALKSTRNGTPNDVLTALANELHEMADGMDKEGGPTAASATLLRTSALLMGSETR